ncbi:MAG: hypothetical protein CMB96_04695 [Flavobacteriaceae bacterium]|nr:hypothetical protein [Flavobacteriaceae bacterium]|tara:strand:+ start:2202 stop:2645 length:444 start_codon:yes stop_codon:yes gene_type:complete
MGYGYGVWLVLPVKGVKTHIPHATIACNMSKEDAFKLYKEYIELNGKNVRCTIDLSHNEILGPDYYEKRDDNNLGWCWAYDVEIEGVTPSNLKNLDLPKSHHVTMQYEYEKEDLCPVKKEIVYSLVGKIEVANITSDIPNEWHIITE